MGFFARAWKGMTHQYLDLKGRSGRMDLLAVSLVSVIVMLVACVIVGGIGGLVGLSDGQLSVLGQLIGAAVAGIPGMSAGVRRLHDTGKSGWLYLLMLLPLVNLLLMGYLLLCPGDPDTNRFGDVPP